MEAIMTFLRLVEVFSKQYTACFSTADLCSCDYSVKSFLALLMERRLDIMYLLPNGHITLNGNTIWLLTVLGFRLVQPLPLTRSLLGSCFHIQIGLAPALELICVHPYASLHKKTASPYVCPKNLRLPSTLGHSPF